ncbi:MAG: RagB/SusD family nutrient uptake outer membrane protein [Bacteroidetes bacterium]|nr:RagB/SusD family nutrient uptake outer membrane protein [Bacteroidota bacterium]
MKYIQNITISLLLLLFAAGCSEELLNLAPKDELSEATAFASYNNVKVYAWGFYEALPAYEGGISGQEMMKDVHADLMQYSWATGSSYLWNNENIPSSSNNWKLPYKRIRRVNIMLDNLEGSDMSQEEKDHWRSVGLFFRSFEFFRLMTIYGGVPWLENEVTDADTEILYGPRNSRDEVAANILRDLEFAAANIMSDGDGVNTINTNVVNALISRFGLFEGTWRKYHNLGNHDQYLNASITASEKLISAFPTLHPNFDEMFNSESLEGINGVILFKRYVEDEMHVLMATNFRSSNASWDITRKGIDKFLCKDGQTVHNSPLFGGYTDKYAEFRNRDNRLLYTTTPPYKVKKTGSQTWEHTGVESDREYFYIMEDISNPLLKTLPDLNWSGNVIAETPNFDEAGFNRTKSTGYRIWKHYNQLNTGRSSADFADAPMFRMGEVLLNYAEAKFEVGSFNQTVADATINKLRVRGDVAPMEVSEIDANFDPTGDTSVDPVLFEIRRERAVELMGEGFRREDLRRWKKMDYGTVVKTGRWVKQSDYTSTLKIQNNEAEGFIQHVPGTPPAFPEYYYLYPLPSDQIVINPQLEQNPSWDQQ